MSNFLESGFQISMGKQVIVALAFLVNVVMVNWILKILIDKFQENCEKLSDTKEFVDSSEENLESGLLLFIAVNLFIKCSINLL